MNKNKVIAVFVFLALCFGARQAWDHSLWFVEDREETGYLSVSDMNVFDASGHQKVNLSSPFFEYASFSDDDMEEEGLQLLGGLKAGYTWDDFVSVFGEYHVSHVHVTSYVEGSGCYYDEEDELEENQMRCPEYSGSESYNDPMTVSEFDQTYVKTGLVNPDRDEIDVNFAARYFRNRIYYDEDAYYDEIFKDMDHFLYGLKGEPRQGSIYFTISFDAKDVYGDEGISYVSISRYGE